MESFINTLIYTSIMIADYYSEGFDKKHQYGQEVLIKPGTVLFTPMDGNLRAIIESEGIKTSTKNFSAVMNQDRAPTGVEES